MKTAFRELLRAKGYGEISVGEIAERADVGRSTFYRHFKAKADVLIALHEETFDRLFSGMDRREAWLGNEPSDGIRAFFEGFRKSCGPMISIAGDIGADADYILMRIPQLIAAHIGTMLGAAFSDEELSIPLPVVAASVAGCFTMALTGWKGAFSDVDGREMAVYVHRLVRAVVQEALER